MSAINPILAGSGRLPVNNGNAQGDPRPAESGDVFVRGEFWANRAAGKDSGKDKDGAQGATKADGTTLSDAEKQRVTQLQGIDTRVRAHEMAHVAVAGSYALSSANFQYQRGPDGRNYAVGGEVAIGVSRESSPQATINKMRVVKAAALAPADPSPQDRRVAAAADTALSEARQELWLQRMTELAVREQKGAAGGSGADKPEDSASASGGPKGAAPTQAEEKGRRQLIGSYLAPAGGDTSNSNGFAVVA